MLKLARRSLWCMSVTRTAVRVVHRVVSAAGNDTLGQMQITQAAILDVRRRDRAAWKVAAFLMFLAKAGIERGQLFEAICLLAHVVHANAKHIKGPVVSRVGGNAKKRVW